jgi:hypothetical protein
MRWMVIYEYEVPGGALNLNSIKTTQTMVAKGIFPFKEKSPWQNRESNPGPHDQYSETLTTRPLGWSHKLDLQDSNLCITTDHDKRY